MDAARPIRALRTRREGQFALKSSRFLKMDAFSAPSYNPFSFNGLCKSIFIPQKQKYGTCPSSIPFTINGLCKSHPSIPFIFSRLSNIGRGGSIPFSKAKALPEQRAGDVPTRAGTHRSARPSTPLGTQKARKGWFGICDADSISSTQRSRAGLTSGAPTALGGQWRVAGGEWRAGSGERGEQPPYICF